MKKIDDAIELLKKAIFEEDACTSKCQYYHTHSGNDYPCSKCVRNATDHFEAKEASADE